MICMVIDMILTAEPATIECWVTLVNVLDALRLSIGIVSIVRVVTDDKNDKAMFACRVIFLYLIGNSLMKKFFHTRVVWTKDDP